MALNLSKLQSESKVATRGGFTVAEKAEIYVTRWARNVKNVTIATAVGKCSARISEICNLDDYEGKRSVELPEFWAAVTKYAATVGFDTKVTNNVAVFTPKTKVAKAKVTKTKVAKTKVEVVAPAAE